MKRKLLLMLLAMMVVSCIASLSACDLSGIPSHTHTFSEDWSFDDTHHWHAATCEHSDQVSD